MAVASLGGCALTPAAGPQVGGGVPLGTNLIGEECRVVAVDTTPADQGAAPAPATAYEIRCGTWEQASGRVVRADALSPLSAAAADSPWRRRIDEFAACDAPETVSLAGNVPALRWQCATRRGGWPYLALAAEIGGHTTLADGIPAAMPVIERGVVLLAGGNPGSAATAAGASAGGERLYSAGDLDTYRVLLRQAQYFNYRGDHAEAERLYREALALQEGRLTATSPGLAFALMHLALELSNQGRFVEAEPLFARADQAVAASLDRTDEARLLGYQAIHLANQRRSQKAIEVARQATTLRDSFAGPATERMAARSFQAFNPMAFNTAAGPATAPLIIEAGSGSTAAAGDRAQSKSLEGAMLLRQGDLDGAEVALQAALAAVDRAPHMPAYWRLRILSLMARVTERRGDPAAAAAQLTDAIEAHRRTAAGSPEEATARLQLSRLQQAMGDRDGSIASFRTAFTILQTAKQSLPLDQALPFFHASMAAVDAMPAERDARAREMFQVAQLARSPRTAQSIDLAAARLARGDRETSRLIRDLQDARRERDAVAQALSRARADPATLGLQLTALEDRQRAANDAAAKLETLVQTAAPRYQMALDAPVEPAALQAALADDEALVQIVVGQSGAFGFIVDRDGIAAYPVNLTEREAERLVTFLRAPFDAVVGAPYDLAKAHQLYQILFGPVEARLQKAKHVIVAAGGALQSLPLGVLVTAAPAAALATDYREVSWLARKWATTMAPSVQSFVRLRTAPPPPPPARALVGFGDFVPERDTDAVLASRGLPAACRAEIEKLGRLPPLTNTGPELRAAAAAFPAGTSDIHLGREFSEATVRDTAANRYGIVYFATHALLPQELSCMNEPMLITSASGSGGSAGDDGLLTASEIMDMSLDADLVVLSACNTAGPDGKPGGDSLSGLARAFFYAGARSLLVTHWRIPDGPTRELMNRFFAVVTDRGGGGATIRTAEALRRAQLAVIDTTPLSHPLNWGAFTVVGDGGGSAAAPRSGGDGTTS